jgi:hypothetical protein
MDYTIDAGARHRLAGFFDQISDVLANVKRRASFVEAIIGNRGFPIIPIATGSPSKHLISFRLVEETIALDAIEISCLPMIASMRGRQHGWKGSGELRGTRAAPSPAGIPAPFDVASCATGVAMQAARPAIPPES